MITRTIAPHLDGRRHETAIDRIDDPFAPVVDGPLTVDQNGVGLIPPVQLEADGTLLIPEEEVPTGGLLVQRSYQAARWIDGTLHVWAAHRTKVSPTVPPSGVRYDYLIE